VAILAPRGGQEVGALDVRLRASDADGDALTMRVSYSGDDGRTWQPVFVGPARAALRLPARYLAHSGRARLRAEVSDGFRETRATSDRFRSDGAPPTVTITSPAGGVRESAGATLVLAGEAVDDARHPLGSRRLTWRLGRRVLGTGPNIAVRGMPAGRRRITLTAVDRFGRAGRASVTVRTTAARPLFLVLAAPRTLGRRAQAVRVRLASSIAASLTILGGSRPRRLVLGSTPITLRLPLGPGRRTVRLRLTLRSGRLATHAQLTVRRRG